MSKYLLVFLKLELNLKLKLELELNLKLELNLELKLNRSMNYAAGNKTVKVVPSLILLSTLIVPFSISTYFLVMDNPSPVP